MNIVDFGGGLGSSYVQNIEYLSKFVSIDTWKIIEQERIVEIGLEEFTANNLSFHFAFSEIHNLYTDLIIFGSVLQYLESPHELLREAFSVKSNFILIDRTPFISGTTDYFGVQQIPRGMYPVDYAIRVFSELNFLNFLESNSYEIIYEWFCELQPDPRSKYKGFLLRRIE
jgi:putative methyltransferase (TIGR04325 family)